jgi:hypothetical protein
LRAPAKQRCGREHRWPQRLKRDIGRRPAPGSRPARGDPRQRPHRVYPVGYREGPDERYPARAGHRFSGWRGAP